MVRHRRLLLLALAATVLATTAVLVVVRPWEDPTACQSIREAAAEQPRQVGDSPDGYAVVLGDSLSAAEDAWVEDFARHTTWTIDAFALPDTGYVAAGACGRDAFSDRVAAVLKADAETVFVQGGMDDLQSAAPARVAENARKVLQALADVRTVTVIGPVDAPALQGEAQLDAALRALASDLGRPYISMLDLEVDLRRDGRHLSPSGQRVYATRIVQTQDS